MKAAAPKVPKPALAGASGSASDAMAARKRRWVTSVDLGELRPEVERACSAAGVGASTWLKALVARELANGLAGTAAELDDPADDPADASIYRARLNARLTAKLDERRLRDGFRSRAAVLRALIDGVGLTRGDGAGAVVSTDTTDTDRPVSLREAVDALGESTFRLVTIGLNVNQIGRSLQADRGSATLSDRQALKQAAAEILRHIKQASVLIGQLRPMLKRPGDVSPEPPPRPPRPERPPR